MTTDVATPPDIQLTSRWLRLAQLAWLVIALTAVGMFVGGAPYGLVDYSTIGPSLTAETLESLKAQDISVQTWATVRVMADLLAGLVGASVGVLIFIRKRDNATALVVSLALITFNTQRPLRGALAEAIPLFAFPQYLLTSLSWTLLALLFAVFPNGRFVPRWTRWLVAVWAISISLPPPLTQPISDEFAGVIFFSFWTVFLLAQIYRYVRASTPSERQQTKWVLAGFVILLVVLVPLMALVALNPPLANSPTLLLLGNPITIVIPLSIGMAMLRSRLWDIDLIIRRTLQYSVLSGLLVLVYFGLIVILQGLFTAVSGQQSAVATVLSTLTIAALFLPLRRRVQAFIDKRFYRQKYDAQKVLNEFGATARDETDLDTLTTRLVDVVQETMQPEKVTLWLKPTTTPKKPP